MDDLATKFINTRPMKVEKSPAKHTEINIRSLKSVKQKYLIKYDSLREDGLQH